jgi:phenylalanyl-tRNA synthetase beta chain
MITSQRAVKLLVELAAGTAAEGVVDAYPVKPEKVQIELDRNRLTQVLGVDIPADKVRDTLTSLGFAVQPEPSDRFQVGVPYWRRDVRIPDDLAEEVARVVGYDQIPIEPIAGRVPPKASQPRRELREWVRDILSAAGMQEVITYPLTDLETLSRVVPPERAGDRDSLAVVNPLNQGQERLRTSLRGSLLTCTAANCRARTEAFALFETARVYLPGEGDLPNEVEHVVGAVTGQRPDRWGRSAGEPVDFFDAKSYVERLFDRLGLDVVYVAAEEYGMIPGRTAEVRAADKRVGVLGQVHPKTAEAFDIDQDVYLFEIILDDLLPLLNPVRDYEPLSRFPSVEEDLALVVDGDLPAHRVRAEILGHPLVAAVRLFDEYVGEQVPRGKKSLAFAVSYQARDRTLTEKEFSRARNKIVERLRRELGAELRS